MKLEYKLILGARTCTGAAVNNESIYPFGLVEVVEFQYMYLSGAFKFSLLWHGQHSMHCSSFEEDNDL